MGKKQRDKVRNRKAADKAEQEPKAMNKRPNKKDQDLRKCVNLLRKT